MKAILKQTSWLIAAQVLTKAIGFFYTIFLAKNLGVEDFGLYTVALAYFSIVSSIADFGFNRYLIREVARDHFKAAELLCNVGILRLTLTSVIFGIFSLILYLLDPDKIRVSLILLATLAILPQSIALTFDGIFIGIQKLQFSATSLIISSFSTVFVGFYLVSKGLGPTGAVNALIFGQTIYVLVLLIFLFKHKILPLSQVNINLLKKVLKGSLPYGLLGILGLLYFRIDAVLLSYLKGNFDAGIYGAAYRFLESVILIPTALSSALFPVAARIHSEKPSQIRPLYFFSIKLMGFLGILIAVLYILLLPFVIKLFLPNYLPSVGVIKILALAIPFVFIHIPGAQILLSTDKYLKPILWLSVFTLAFNFILNVIFIPQFSFIAAAWVTVLSEALSFIVFFQLLKIKILK